MDTSIHRTRVIVVGVDGSSSSIAALKLAGSLTPLAGDTLRVVAAWQFPLAFGLYAPPVEYDYEALAHQVLQESITEAFPDGPPCAVESIVEQGLAAEILIRESRSASMVVVGSRGHGGFVGLLIGSVSTAVAERAECPVLVSHGTLELDESIDVAQQPVGASA